MLSASNRGSGTNLGSPDLCLTPTGTGVDATIPYVNTALQAQSQNAAKVTYVNMMSALNSGSTVPSSNGDEAGTSHPTKCGTAAYTTGSPTVFVESMPGIILTSATTQNTGNCVGTVSTPGSATVMFTRRGTSLPTLGEALPLDGASREALERSLDGRAVAAHALADDGVARVRVRFFAHALVSELAALLSGELRTARALHLDLRGVPGGALSAAVRLAGRFLPRRSIVARVLELDGDERIMRGGCSEPWPHEVVIQVDAHTASAAEVFAGALLHHGRARLDGAPETYGKASVQCLVASDGRPVLATVAEVRGPGGEIIEGVGLAAFTAAAR